MIVLVILKKCQRCSETFFCGLSCHLHVCYHEEGQNVRVRFRHQESEMEKMNKALLFITRLARQTTEHSISICITLKSHSSVPVLRMRL